MTAPVKLGTQAIGAAGELLVQYQLLKQGIDSARLTTDSGIDLVMYVPGHRSAATIQVKTNLASKPAGGKGKELLTCRFPMTQRRNGWPVWTCPPTARGCSR